MDPDECLQEIGRHLTQMGGDYVRCLELIESLADWLRSDGYKPKENPNAYDWEDVITGAYWFCVHNHGGQWSDEYRIQCKLSDLYNPGICAKGPEPDSTEKMVYDDLTNLSDDETAFQEWEEEEEES